MRLQGKMTMFPISFDRKIPLISAPVRWCIVFCVCAVAPVGGAEVVLRLAPEPSHAVSPLLFGQFLERTNGNGGEIGPEAAYIPGTKQWQPGVVEALEKLHASVIRFPGGSMLGSLYDWTVMIDHSPFRESGRRPEGYRFGWHEYFDLCKTLGAKPLVGVNFRAAVWGVRPEDLPDDPENLAAGLVAYCNSPVGAKLPDGMPDWPAYRAKNGHSEPFGVEYFQIGNEWIGWLQNTNGVRTILGKEGFEDDEALAAHTAQRLLDMIEAMRAVDPDINIIIDAVLWQDPRMPVWIGGVLADPRVQAAADFATVHLYRPWSVNDFTRNGQPVSGDRLSPEEIWYATVAAPDIDERGFSVIDSEAWWLARKHDWPVVMTEWNWNGWGVERRGATLWPRALGVAGFLHAILRESEHIHLATQSMMLGNSWMINGVRVDPAAEESPFVMPSGRMTGFYAEHSGDRYLPTDISGTPAREQPVGMGTLTPVPRLSLVDAVATEDDGRVYLHVINRDKDRAHRLRIEAPGRTFAAEVRVHRLSGKAWKPQVQKFVSPDQFSEQSESQDFDPAVDTIELPAGSVTIVELVKQP